jgi:ankyrin repeat protein
VKVCEALLEGGALIGEGDDTDDTALMYAAREGKTATVAVLLRATDKAGREGTTGRGGWGIAVKNTGMQSAHHFAAFHGHINVLRQLHTYAMVSGSGRVPGHSSRDNRELRRTTYNAQIAELTVVKAAAVEAEEYEEAQRVKDKIDDLKKTLKLVEPLEERNAGGDDDGDVPEDIKHWIDVDAAGEKGMNALMLAAFKGQSNMVELLVQNRASVDVAQDRGYTPLLLAAKQGHTRVALFLISSGANIHHRNIYDDTALGCAAWEGHTWTVDALLRLGADPYVINTYKLSPLLQVRVYRCERGGGR